MAEVTNDVFHHYYSAVHDHAKVQSPERKQIRRDVTEVKADGGKEEGKRNGERDNKSAANIPQKEKENNYDKDDAFSKVMQNRVRGVVKQIASIKEWNDLYARRQDEFVEFVNFLMNAAQG